MDVEINETAAYVQEQIPFIIDFGIKVLVAILFFFLGRVAIKWLRKLVRRSFNRSHMDKGVEQFVDSVLKFALYFLLIFMIATELGLNMTSAAALIASGGVTAGLAFQESLSNFAGGILILLLKPFEVGDYIIEDTGKNEGTVAEIQIFYTKLLTISNETVVIPNGTLMNGSLTNLTMQSERRLDLKIGITYESDLRKAKAVIEKLVSGDPCVLQDREVNVFVDALAENAVVIGVRGWTSNGDFWATKWRLLEGIKLALDENGIEIAYPQMAVHMEEKMSKQNKNQAKGEEE